MRLGIAFELAERRSARRRSVCIGVGGRRIRRRQLWDENELGYSHDRLTLEALLRRVRRCLLRLDRTDYANVITTQVGNVDAARARLQQAAAEEARYSGLVSSGAVSQSAYDQVKAASDSARALLSAAEAQLRVAQDEGAYATLSGRVAAWEKDV